MNKKLQTFKYITIDIITSITSWYCFHLFRKIYIESKNYGVDIPIEFNNKFWLSLIIVPFFWTLLHYSIGYYTDVYRKSRLQELGHTLTVTIIGVIILFFALIIDDTIFHYKDYYRSISALLILQFFLTYIPRLIITTNTVHKVQNKKIGFNTIIVGSNEKALSAYLELENVEKSFGYNFIGFLNLYDKEEYLLKKHLPHLGSINKLRDIIDEYKIEEVIIAPEKQEHEEVGNIMNKIQDKNVLIKVIPEMYAILSGAVKMNTIFGVPLILIQFDIMPQWQKILKRLIDIVASFFALIILFPLYLFLAIGVKLSSKGPIFYSHERIGEHGKPFIIFKFRSMFVDAEKNGPALSSKNDSRITKFGLFMRKTRMDELPQFFNVIIGDMSLVGPRPERQFFIDQIVQKAPHYLHLQKVRPGITSLGQVKYGYAENVDQMVQRLKYDLLYLENMSLYVDFKILIYTVLIVFKGKGK